MIRTAYPVPPMKQLSLRFELATRRTRRALEQRRRTLIVDTKAPRAAQEDYLHLRWREDLEREQAAFTAFYERYDTLVGLLCLAAHEGNNAETEEEYREHRTWFTANYADVKRSLALHLESDESDTFPTRFGRRACDAFEALYQPPTLHSLLENDGGTLIGRMMRTQNALEARKQMLQHQAAALQTSVA